MNRLFLVDGDRWDAFHPLIINPGGEGVGAQHIGRCLWLATDDLMPPWQPATKWVVKMVGDQLAGHSDTLSFSISRENGRFFVGPGSDVSEAVKEATACAVLGWTILEGGVLLHSSAVGFAGAAHLFPGPSGVGKTTTARWAASQGATALATDQTALLPDPASQGWLAAGDEGSGVLLPLSRISLLGRGEVTQRRPLGRGEALAALMSNVILWPGADALHELVLGRVLALVQALEVSRLDVDLATRTPALVLHE